MSLGKTFLISASTLMSGTIVAQAITFALSFALTRLYGPAEFGHYSIFVGYAAVFGAASTGALDRVIVMGRTDAEARRAATTLFVLSVLAAAFVSLVGVLLGLTGWAAYLPLNAFDLAVFVPIFMICYAGGQALTYSCLREGRVRRLATLKASQSLVMGAIQLLASGGKVVPGLILGNIAGWLILCSAGARWRLSKGHVRQDLRMRSLTALARRHRLYPRYVMPNEVLDNLSGQLPVFLIGTFLSLSLAGQYGLALMVLSAPAALLGQALAQAFLQYMGRHENDPVALGRAARRIWAGMALVGAVPFGTILLFGPVIFHVGFGQKWTEAGVIAQLFAVLLFVRFVSSPTSTLYWKLKMQREQWYFAVGAAIYRSGCYVLTAFGFGLSTVIILHVAIESLAILFYNIVALRRLSTLSGSTSAALAT